MTRQCLYCAKELPKGSASNFCSKECWTEYKKLKAMNVGADKQATVLLKRSEIQGNKQPITSQSVAQSQPTSAPESEENNLNLRIEALERSINDKFIKLSDSVKSQIQELGNAGDSGKPHASDDLVKRLTLLEQRFNEIEQTFRSFTKLEDRIHLLEKKIRQGGTSQNIKKQGFFARLFG